MFFAARNSKIESLPILPLSSENGWIIMNWAWRTAAWIIGFRSSLREKSSQFSISSPTNIGSGRTIEVWSGKKAELPKLTCVVLHTIEVLFSSGKLSESKACTDLSKGMEKGRPFFSSLKPNLVASIIQNPPYISFSFKRKGNTKATTPRFLRLLQ